MPSLPTPYSKSILILGEEKINKKLSPCKPGNSSFFPLVTKLFKSGVSALHLYSSVSIHFLISTFCPLYSAESGCGPFLLQPLGSCDMGAFLPWLAWHFSPVFLSTFLMFLSWFVVVVVCFFLILPPLSALWVSVFLYSFSPFSPLMTWSMVLVSSTYYFP